MTRLEQAEDLLSEMTPAESALFVQRAIQRMGDAFPGIESSPSICGGEARIVRTRIPVWVIEQARRLGTSDADLLHAYPTLRAEDVAAAHAYARSHCEEIDKAIRENEAA